VQPLYGQTDCCCSFKDKYSYERVLSGELSAIPTDTTTYFNNDWQLGDIFLIDGEEIKNEYIKYNFLLDELFWFEPKSGETIKLDKEAIAKFHFLNLNGDTSFFFRKIKIKKDVFADSSEIFTQEIYLGKLSLFVFHSIYVAERVTITKNNDLFEKEIYLKKPIYILSFANKKTVVVKSLTWKTLSTLLPEKKEQIKHFFKQARRVKIEIYPHMILLMKFLNYLADQ
jgi:hypothetical protein